MSLSCLNRVKRGADGKRPLELEITEEDENKTPRTLYFVNFHSHDPESSYHFSEDEIYMLIDKKVAIEKAFELYRKNVEYSDNVIDDIWIKHIGNWSIFMSGESNIGTRTTQVYDYLGKIAYQNLKDVGKCEFSVSCAFATIKIFEKVTPLFDDCTFIGNFGYQF